MKAGGTGAAVVADKPGDSILLQQIEHKAKPFMPPPKKAKKLGDEEIAVIRDWIQAGAPGLKPGEVLAKIVAVPKIAPKVTPRQSIQSLAVDPASKTLALARLGVVELRSMETRAILRTLSG